MAGRNKKTRESGYSLIEVLAAVVILSFATLALTAFFTNSLAYTKGNQNKTVMVNLARNALVYIEKQPFDPIKEYFIDERNDNITCEITGCDTDVNDLVGDASILNEVLNPTVNGVQYRLEIIYQKDLHDSMRGDVDKSKLADLLLPIRVAVRRDDGRTGARNASEVEGYITSEKIR